MGNSLIGLAQPMFIRQRQYFHREYASKFYGWWQFAVTILTVEIPYLIATAGNVDRYSNGNCVLIDLFVGIFVLLYYWITGLNSTAMNGFYYYIAFVNFFFFAVTFGQSIAYVSEADRDRRLLTLLPLGHSVQH